MDTKTFCFVFVLMLSFECVSSADTTTPAICGTATCTTDQVCETNDGAQSCKKGEGSVCMLPTVTTTIATASSAPTTAAPGTGVTGTAQITLAPTVQGSNVISTASTTLPTVINANNTTPVNGTIRKRRAGTPATPATSECVLNAECVQEASSPICRCMTGFNVHDGHFCQQDSGADSAKSSVMLASMIMLLLFFNM